MTAFENLDRLELPSENQSAEWTEVSPAVGVYALSFALVDDIQRAWYSMTSNSGWSGKGYCKQQGTFKLFINSTYMQDAFGRRRLVVGDSLAYASK